MTSPSLRGFHPVTVVDVVHETADARSYVLAVPDHLGAAFSYQAGQYLTFRLPAAETPVLRCYSMSSSPDTGEPLRTTVKRVPGGIGSNWVIDHLCPGNVVEATIPAGRFVAGPDEGPLIAFAAGSGITPVLSIIKSVLTTSDRSVRLLYANRDPASVIFAAELDGLADRHPGRLVVVHHLDDTHGYVSDRDVLDLMGPTTGVHVYLCGPTPFMDLVETTLTASGVEPGLILSERFVTPGPEEGDAKAAAGPSVAKVVVTIGRDTRELPYYPGETILETARRGAMLPPFSCQAGNCATCMARVIEGEVSMRVNDALYPEEVADGWILTCQAVPTTPLVRVVYES